MVVSQQDNCECLSQLVQVFYMIKGQDKGDISTSSFEVLRYLVLYCRVLIHFCKQSQRILPPGIGRKLTTSTQLLSYSYRVARFSVGDAVTLVQGHKCYSVAPAFYSDIYHLSQGESRQGFCSRSVPVTQLLSVTFPVQTSKHV